MTCKNGREEARMEIDEQCLINEPQMSPGPISLAGVVDVLESLPKFDGLYEGTTNSGEDYNRPVGIKFDQGSVPMSTDEALALLAAPSWLNGVLAELLRYRAAVNLAWGAMSGAEMVGGPSEREAQKIAYDALAPLVVHRCHGA